MKKSLLTASALLFTAFAPLLAASPAMAADPSLDGAAAVGPTRGSNELRLGQGFIPGVTLQGLTFFTAGVSDGELASGETLGLFALSAGYGRFLTDNVEAGVNLNVLLGFADGDALVSPGIAPFVRVMTAPARLRFFAEASLVYQPFLTDDSLHLFGAGGDAGVELAVTPSWGIRVAPTYRYLRAAAGGETSDSGVHAYGVNWGIAAYF